MRIDRSFINNEFLTSDGETLVAVLNPATGGQIAHVAAASAAEARAAVDAAAHAQRGWRRLTSVQRAGHLRALADALVARKDKIGGTLALESGKSLEDATSEVVYAAELTRYHAEWARRIEGEIIPSDSPDENLLLQREPIGVVAALIPFNYPVYTLMRKIAPALIAGNTVVARPSNNTPSSALEIARAVRESGFPAGAINIVAMTHQTAQSVCTHPKVGMITLTGSVGAGRKVLEYSQVNIAKASLELGGKTPAIIEADADLEKAAAAVVASRTTHCGQLCTAIERVYVQDSVHDRFVELLREHMAARSFGDRMQHPQAMGPLINANSRLNIHQMVERAIDDGARLETGGFIPEGPGWFYPPTLLTNCRQQMEIVQEEVFGPVLPVLRYETTEDALDMANDHQFGLSSVIYTENYRKAMQVANNIEAGEVYINRTPADPYQGYHSGWKRSGLGGDDGKHGMLDFTQTRLVIQSW
ncbi:aldehyde dehydrogenase [Pseudogemmobacter humi]|uniref:Lactaldehyde dehydrogenase n=1 Tax=Pseudogemmobacter humi TaxID=2483812 RepID=A0A3P5WXV4_9RHOB|nr:aldehyde dehydrogenase [Pseudogemmobacter humi]VDC26558.1 Lactaldehyde dehydrogenase [Pseudogemmobacter humi]